MKNVIPLESAIRACMKFAGNYGIDTVTISTTTAQRCLSRGDLILHSDNEMVFDVKIENIMFPHLAVRGVAQVLMINFNLCHINADQLIEG